jgi:hypothetical protein
MPPLKLWRIYDPPSAKYTWEAKEIVRPDAKNEVGKRWPGWRNLMQHYEVLLGRRRVNLIKEAITEFCELPEGVSAGVPDKASHSGSSPRRSGEELLDQMDRDFWNKTDAEVTAFGETQRGKDLTAIMEGLDRAIEDAEKGFQEMRQQEREAHDRIAQKDVLALFMEVKGAGGDKGLVLEAPDNLSGTLAMGVADEAKLDQAIAEGAKQLPDRSNFKYGIPHEILYKEVLDSEDVIDRVNYAKRAKVVLRVQLADLPLSPPELDVLREICGRRVHGSQLRLVGKRFALREENERHVYDLLRQLIEECKRLAPLLPPPKRRVTRKEVNREKARERAKILKEHQAAASSAQVQPPNSSPAPAASP